MNDSEEFVDQILTSLKIIAMIKEGQKVCVRNGHLALEAQSTGIVISFKRWLHGDNRSTTICYIKNIVNNALSVIKNHKDPYSVDKIKTALEDAMNGVSSLIVTYDDDVAITATLHVLKDRVKHIQEC